MYCISNRLATDIALLLMQRHDELAAEMESRGYKHRSPLLQPDPYPAAWDKVRIDRASALEELHRRCPECRNGVT